MDTGRKISELKASGYANKSWVTEDQTMRRAFASLAIIAFAGLLGTSLLTVFNNTTAGSRYLNSQPMAYPYLMVY